MTCTVSEAHFRTLVRIPPDDTKLCTGTAKTFGQIWLQSIDSVNSLPIHC